MISRVLIQLNYKTLNEMEEFMCNLYVFRFNNNKVAPEEFTHPPPERIKMSPIKSNGNHISNGVHLPRVVDTNA